MSSNPSSHLITLVDRPMVDENGEIVVRPLKLHYWEWKGHKPTIILCHAASLHGRCYDHIIDDALRGFHVISLDLRGHGRSQKHPAPYRFPWIGDDIFHFIEQMNLSAEYLIGIGHSLGGYALTRAAVVAPRRLFQSLLLIDPGIVSLSIYGLGDQKVDALEYIRRRKTEWNSVEEMMERLIQRPPFSQWPKDVIVSYCTYALDENCKLQCTPEAEHSMYLSGLASHSNIYPLIEQSKFLQDTPVHIVRSKLPLVVGRFETSPTAPDLIKWFRKGKYTELKEVEHFFPMAQADLMRNLVRNHLKDNFRSRL